MRGIFILFFLTGSIFANTNDIKQLFNRKIVIVKKKSLEEKKSFYATTKLNESLMSDTTLRFSGYITKLFANKSMQYVKKGDTLFSIYSKELASIYEEIEVAKKYNKSLVSSLNKKLLLLDAPKLYSGDYSVDIKSPSSGIILEKKINSGSFLKQGNAAFKVASLKNIWVVAKIYQEDLADIRVGQNAAVYIKGLGKFTGKVDYIYPYMDSKSKTIDVRVVLENKNSLIYPNLFAKVTIVDKKRDILALPKSAVLTKGSKHYVFIPHKDGSYEPKEVKAKRVNSDMYEILSGLKEGQKVIDSALFLLDSDAITNGLYESGDEEW